MEFERELAAMHAVYNLRTYLLPRRMVLGHKPCVEELGAGVSELYFYVLFKKWEAVTVILNSIHHGCLSQ